MLSVILYNIPVFLYNVWIYVYMYLYMCTYISVYMDMVIRRKTIHGVRLDPAKICTGPSEPSQLYLLQGDKWHYPCGTVRAILRNVSSQHWLLRGFPSGSQEMRRCFLPDKPWTRRDWNQTSETAVQRGEGRALWVCPSFQGRVEAQCLQAVIPVWTFS